MNDEIEMSNFDDLERQNIVRKKSFLNIFKRKKKSYLNR